MTSEKLPKEYQQWIEEEKSLSEDAYFLFKAEDKRQKAKIGHKRKGISTKLSYKSVILRAAAAVLVLALGTTMWLKRDTIFKTNPNYTEEQIALSYEHAVKALTMCANSLSSEMSQIKKLDQIPESLEEIKSLKTVINN